MTQKSHVQKVPRLTFIVFLFVFFFHCLQKRNTLGVSATCLLRGSFLKTILVATKKQFVQILCGMKYGLYKTILKKLIHNNEQFWKAQKPFGIWYIWSPTSSGVIADGDIGDSPMVNKMGDIRELHSDSRCHFNRKTQLLKLYYVRFRDNWYDLQVLQLKYPRRFRFQCFLVQSFWLLWTLLCKQRQLPVKVTCLFPAFLT